VGWRLVRRSSKRVGGNITTTSVSAAAEEGRFFQRAMYLVQSYESAQFLLESTMPECIRLRIACFLGIFWI
jgi:hypothetical protein